MATPRTHASASRPSLHAAPPNKMPERPKPGMQMDLKTYASMRHWQVIFLDLDLALPEPVKGGDHMYDLTGRRAYLLGPMTARASLDYYRMNRRSLTDDTQLLVQFEVASANALHQVQERMQDYERLEVRQLEIADALAQLGFDLNSLSEEEQERAQSLRSEYRQLTQQMQAIVREPMPRPYEIDQNGNAQVMGSSTPLVGDFAVHRDMLCAFILAQGGRVVSAQRFESSDPGDFEVVAAEVEEILDDAPLGFFSRQVISPSALELFDMEIPEGQPLPTMPLYSHMLAVSGLYTRPDRLRRMEEADQSGAMEKKQSAEPDPLGDAEGN